MGLGWNRQGNVEFPPIDISGCFVSGGHSLTGVVDHGKLFHVFKDVVAAEFLNAFGNGFESRDFEDSASWWGFPLSIG